ncbi:MAG: hypothetical protein FWD44_09895 [Oscillospiraceae bacterium]|nr:hypothetical protein [Oscillospiraceae bacterium]
MKKLLTLTLAVLMVLTVVACGTGGGGGGTQNDPPANNDPVTTPTQNDPATTPNGGDNQGGGDPGANGDNQNNSDPNPGGSTSDDIPNNGTPVQAPAQFEVHKGDKGYFYEKSDDFMIYKLNSVPRTTHGPDYDSYGEAVLYRLVCFDADGNEGTHGTQSKWVFETEEHARDFAGYVEFTDVVDNIVYRSVINGGTKEITISNAQLMIDEHGGEMYLSKP